MKSTKPVFFNADKILCYVPVNFDPQDFKSKRIRLVIFLTCLTFLVEIVAGYLTGSMALQADAWHMLTHILALSINLLAYSLSKNFSKDHRFYFGVTKINSLGGYTSSIVLFAVAMGMVFESVRRIFYPEAILFRDALIVAIIGLVVNLLSAWILSAETQGHEHSHQEGESHNHHDHNYQSAYLHVIADALTSFLAILALLIGLFFDWKIFDALIGILGSVIIIKWAYSLFKSCALRLLDFTENQSLQEKILVVIQKLPGTQVLDFHLWPHGEKSYYLMLSLKSDASQKISVQTVKDHLNVFEELKHVTVEITQ